MTLNEAKVLLAPYILIAKITDHNRNQVFLDSYNGQEFQVALTMKDGLCYASDRRPPYLVQAAELYAAYILGPGFYDSKRA